MTFIQQLGTNKEGASSFVNSKVRPACLNCAAGKNFQPFVDTISGDKNYYLQVSCPLFGSCETARLVNNERYEPIVRFGYDA